MATSREFIQAMRERCCGGKASTRKSCIKGLELALAHRLAANFEIPNVRMEYSDLLSLMSALKC